MFPDGGRCQPDVKVDYQEGGGVEAELGVAREKRLLGLLQDVGVLQV